MSQKTHPGRPKEGRHQKTEIEDGRGDPIDAQVVYPPPGGQLTPPPPGRGCDDQ